MSFITNGLASVLNYIRGPATVSDHSESQSQVPRHRVFRVRAPDGLDIIITTSPSGLLDINMGDRHYSMEVPVPYYVEETTAEVSEANSADDAHSETGSKQNSAPEDAAENHDPTPTEMHQTHLARGIKSRDFAVAPSLRAKPAAVYWSAPGYMGDYEWHVSMGLRTRRRPLLGMIPRRLIDIGWLTLEELHRRARPMDINALALYDRVPRVEHKPLYEGCSMHQTGDAHDKVYPTFDEIPPPLGGPDRVKMFMWRRQLNHLKDRVYWADPKAQEATDAMTFNVLHSITPSPPVLSSSPQRALASTATVKANEEYQSKPQPPPTHIPIPAPPTIRSLASIKRAYEEDDASDIHSQAESSLQDAPMRKRRRVGTLPTTKSDSSASTSSSSSFTHPIHVPPPSLTRTLSRTSTQDASSFGSTTGSPSTSQTRTAVPVPVLNRLVRDNRTFYGV